MSTRLTIHNGAIISGSLDVSGSGRFTDGLTVTGSLNVTGSRIILAVTGGVSRPTIRMDETGFFLGGFIGSVLSFTNANVVSATSQTWNYGKISIGGFDTSISTTSNRLNVKTTTTGSDSNAIIVVNSSDRELFKINGAGETITSGSLLVSGSGRFTNGLTVTGSATITDVLTLPFQDPLPSGKPTGSIALSGSGATYAGMFVYDGTNWVTA